MVQKKTAPTRQQLDAQEDRIAEERKAADRKLADLEAALARGEITPASALARAFIAGCGFEAKLTELDQEFAKRG